MNVYSYDNKTFEYIGICKAYEDPKGDNYLLPACSTQLAPPERGDNEIPVFNLNSNQWELKPDYRNSIWYVKSDSSEYQGEKYIGEVQGKYTIKEKPEGFYKWNEERQDWELDQAQVEANKEQEYINDLIALNPMIQHINMHVEDEEEERVERARYLYHIAKAELLEKYGKGSTVFITENGECYHKDKECTGLANSTNVVEINLSDGLKNYSPCSMCS